MKGAVILRGELSNPAERGKAHGSHHVDDNLHHSNI